MPRELRRPPAAARRPGDEESTKKRGILVISLRMKWKRSISRISTLPGFTNPFFYWLHCKIFNFSAATFFSGLFFGIFQRKCQPNNTTAGSTATSTRARPHHDFHATAGCSHHRRNSGPPTFALFSPKTSLLVGVKVFHLKPPGG